MKKFDFLIVGSGFSGSITAMALVNSGFSVCLIERNKHPRFAVGESSTPIADMILRDLAEQYRLPFLKKISRYGEWQKNYPQIVCGLKRGFSYYHHKKGERFTSDKYHSNELLVAASENDLNSDTNWLRSDVDHFLVKKAIETGVVYFDETEVRILSRNTKKEVWSAVLTKSEKPEKISCRWIIDASGNPDFSTSFLNTENSSREFQTNSSAVFTHFDEAKTWSDYLKANKFETSDYPYNPDYSALHHLLEEGWMWMLRFNNNRLSAGILLDGDYKQPNVDKSPEEIWNFILHQYPSLKELFDESNIAEKPGRFFRTKRLQRSLNKLYGNGWVVLPHTAGFVDPLHSTGIAHTLCGVEYILDLFTKNMTEENRRMQLKMYEEKVFNELGLIDLLVSSSYHTRRNPELFEASVMLYFIASVRYEQRRLQGDIPFTFLGADEPSIKEIVQKTFDEIKNLNLNSISKQETDAYIQKIRRRIEPYNSAGLMDTEARHLYHHTAVTL